MIQQILTWTQITSAVLLIVTILMQQRGAGSAGLFGGVGGVYQQRRGIEKFMFYSTIVLAIIFLGSIVASVFLVK